MNWIKINCDGGCKPTNPGNKYGSFEVQLNQVQVFKASWIELGYGTSNEAEFDILIEALKWTHENLLLAGLPPSKYILSVFTDSRTPDNWIPFECEMFVFLMLGIVALLECNSKSSDHD